MNKPFLALRVAGVVAALLVACAGGASANPDATATPQPTVTPFIPYDAYQATLSVENTRIVEGDSGIKTLDFQIKVTGYFRVNKTPIEKDDYKVSFQTQDETATANSDYTPVATTFDVGNSGFSGRTITISVPIKSDTLVEPDEVLKGMFQAGKRVSFATSSNSFASSFTALGTIANDDFAPVAYGGKLTVVAGIEGEATLNATGKAGTTSGFRIVSRPANGVGKILQRGGALVLSYISRRDFVGEDSLSIQAFDGKSAGPAATWKVRVLANQIPALIGVSPDTGTFGANQETAFLLQAKDGNGTANLRALFLSVSNSATRPIAANAIAIWFDPQTRLFCLRSDDGRTWSPWMPLGSSLENAQGKVFVGVKDVGRARNGTLSIRPRITFKSGWTGSKTLWARVEDKGGLTDGFRVVGSILLAPPSPSGSGSAPQS